MSIIQLRREVETLIGNSGRKPHMKMRCSLMRTLKMRHGDLDPAITRDVIDLTIRGLS